MVRWVSVWVLGSVGAPCSSSSSNASPVSPALAHASSWFHSRFLLPETARVSAVARNRILYRDGVAIAVIESGEVRRLVHDLDVDDETLKRAGGKARSAEPQVGRPTVVARPYRVPLGAVVGAIAGAVANSID